MNKQVITKVKESANLAVLTHDITFLTCNSVDFFTKQPWCTSFCITHDYQGGQKKKNRQTVLASINTFLKLRQVNARFPSFLRYSSITLK